MRGTKKIFGWLIAFSCMGSLLAAYASTHRTPFRYVIPEPAAPSAPEPLLPDTTIKLKYPIQDRQGDFVSDKQTNPFYLKDPPAVQESVDYDPVTGMYVVSEKAGGIDVRPPMYMSYDDYLKYTEQQEMKNYWKERANAVNLVEEKSLIPPVQIKNQMLDRLFGGSKIEIKPQGNVEMTLGANIQKTANPNIPIRNRQTGGFNFDMNINMNVIGKIGDKLQLGIKYNTQSGFAFDNQVKIGYTGGKDDIIKSIEAGNVSLPLPTRLITGSQSLFGVKTVLQFGRLTWTSVVSQQQSKKQSITLQNGAQQQNFSVNSDQYEENKNFFLGQFFYNQYDEALAHLPKINSNANITRIEVWVTNRVNATTNVRNVVGIADLGEAEPYSNQIASTAGGNGLPRNQANNIYSRLTSIPSNRLDGSVVAVMSGPGYNLLQGQDFEKIYARKLNPNEFTFSPQLGFISVNSQLNPNDILAVAYEYTYNGIVYRVGEFGDDVPPDSGSVSKDLYLKLLKGTAPRTKLPIWHLMMKNIYSLGAFGISNKNFFLDVYYNDPGGGLKRYIPQGCLQGTPLLKILNLDNLDLNNDAVPDGLFDFIPGVDILPQNGKLIFPVKEPFGKNLQAAANKCGSPGDSVFVYEQLYDSTKYEAQQFPQYNRFVIKGTYTGTNGSTISLGAGNIPRGSVTVTAGGIKLVEGSDYTVDYNLGRVTVTNQSILNSQQQIKVDFENNNQFATQVQSMYGTRLDYKVNEKLNIGATLIRLGERPFTQKVSIGDEPIQNTIMGLDVNYKTNLPWLTRAINYLYPTKEMSTLAAYGEFAYLKPGHSKAINGTNGQGQVYIDDFEGTSSGYDLKTPSIAWKLASTPRNSPNLSGRVQFPEGSLVNNEAYGYNRALMAWYRIDNSFYTQQTSPSAVYNNTDYYRNINSHYSRLVPYTEVFPNATPGTLDVNLYTFDVAYYPTQRGPYNYESKPNGLSPYSSGVNSDGTLKNPANRWGGIMRAMDNTDFVATNVQYIEFWMLDPFLYRGGGGGINLGGQGGYLYIDLGNISEDILQDSRQAFENGLVADTTTMDNTFWGVVPKLVPLVNAFDNDPTLRPLQDVGLDGLSDAEERARKGAFLTSVSATVTNPSELAKLNSDPSSDNFRYFQDPSIASDPAILNCYKYISGTEGNSPVQTNSIATTAGTSLPDKEDLNNDNTMNEDEEYFQYVVHLYPGMNSTNSPFIVTDQDVTNDPNIGKDQNGITAIWHQFKIPITAYQSRVGAIGDFTSIQFMRMFLTGWNDSVVLRFGTFQLTRNQWRTYNLSLDDGCDNTSPHPTAGAFFNVAAVGLENNGTKVPVNYVIPPGIQRQQVLGAQTNQYIQQDEQSLDLTVGDLPDCARKALFKNITLDIRNYTNLEMYVHANRVENRPVVRDSEVTAFIRIGSDFVDNYYEYEVPLLITPDGTYNNSSNNDQLSVWPLGNTMNINIQDFVKLKEKRNATAGFPLDAPFTSHDASGNLITIKGNPDIGGVKTIMLGVHNPHKNDPNDPLKGNRDDGQPKFVEVWFDELRLNGFNEHGGVAALTNINVKMADLGTIGLAGAMHTAGFGQVDQTMDQLAKDNLYSYNVTTGVEAGKFLPAALGIRIPFYANYSQSLSTPEYDPYQFDIKSKEQFNIIRNLYGPDSLKKYQHEVRTINTTRGYNFTNVRIVPKTKAKRAHIYDPGNFNFTYSYNNISYSDPFTAINSQETWLGLIGWSFAPQAKDLAPFKKLIKSKSKWLDLVRDFSWNPYPSTLAVTSNWNKTLNTIQLRSLGSVDFAIQPEYSRNFIWTRNYTFKYNPFKSLSLEYTASDRAVIDQILDGNGTVASKQQIWKEVEKGGRNTNYNQSMAINYNIPFSKVPALDFITSNVGYNTTYNWTALPLQLKGVTDPNHPNADSMNLVPSTLGNIINNTQADHGKIDFNFKKLYDKNPFLKTYDSPNPNLGDRKENKKKHDAVKNARLKIKEEITKLVEKGEKLKGDLQIVKDDKTMDEDKRTKEIAKLKKDIKSNKKAIKLKKKEYREKQYPADPFISIIMRPLLSLKKIGVNYSENIATTLPGFTGYSRILGNDFTSSNSNGPASRNAPGYAYTFGLQPGDNILHGMNAATRTAWLNRAAANNWISRDTLLNQQFTESNSNRLDVTASFEPWTDFKIDLTLFRAYSDNYSEYFKMIDSTYADGSVHGNYMHLTPMDAGSYSISYLPIKTLFSKVSNSGYSAIYNTFVANRAIISQRLGHQNPNSRPHVTYYNPSDSLYASGFSDGYGPLSQDVLIPAFLAAYQKSNPNKITLNPFNSIPMPNWRISYNGFSKFKWAQKYFTNFTVTSGYSSTLTVSSYSTNLQYAGSGSMTGGRSRDSLSNNFFSLYNMPSVTINESLSPLIGVDMTMKNNVTAKFDFKMSRTLTMTFADFQMVQINTKQITVGAGYKIKGLKLPFKLPNGKKIRLDNDLTFRFDFSYRDDITVNNQIDQGPPQITQGATTITIQPSIDYIISKRLTVRLFYDESKTIPKISSTYPTTNIKSGITFRFSLAE